ncbi:MAG TPA: ribonuclease HI family protein [Spirochaetota bacterium]|nr:ribonuclease HI family protein [Spirochaetota bacterium]HOM86490.1 ribonuclease HI family protein [Spirochaetota bacterium]HOR94319.1 ribonuclease HI family protein [Spirochaetota bacterium]HOT18392.1 ribonuclease HI family protein [Spirochaetota bacterium]HPD03727.1 ribonuclease HI family protein [Spirochaetota bacterium]
MLLSIDRVLQLLAEGKSIEKIAELANVDSSDVLAIIEEARKIVNQFDKQKSKSKIIIKKKNNINTQIPMEMKETDEELFDGFEVLSTIPTESVLTMYVDGASKGNPGPAGIGIVIYNNDDQFVGKVSSYIGKKTNNQAEYIALIRAMLIAIYFKTKTLKIRSDSELVVRQLLGEYQVNNSQIKKLYDKVMELKKQIPNFKIEHVMRNFNERADFLAKKAADKKI